MKLSTTTVILLSTTLFAGTVAAIDVVDLNGDGVVTTDEVSAARDAARAERVELFDTDNDGELSDDEREAARDARREAAVEEFDANEDGELSREERQDARQSRRADFQASFDLDGDSELSDTEQANFDDVVEEIRETRQENRDSGSRGGDRQRGNGGRSRR
ncbi:MAG: hypothetical protein ACI9UN_001923 [Granulosicoccus sp.]|jgi:hypothetical protein